MIKKFNLKLLLLLCLPLGLLSFTFDGNTGINFQTDRWGQVIKTAQESQKPIFIFIGTKSCILSCNMEEEMASNNELADFYNAHFVCARMDPSDIMTNFRLTNWGLDRVPAIVFMNAKRKIVYAVNGYMDAKKLMTEGYKAANLIDKDSSEFVYSVNNK